MRDSDDITNIPPIVPTRDDVATHRQSRKGQSQEIVRPNYRVEKRTVSSWPVRVLLAILTLALIGGGAGAYYFYGEYESNLREADLRISDLERRLALVGETSEDSVVNIQESLDFHFSEIDKLWAARNTLRTEATDLQSEIARLVLANQGQDESVSNLALQVETNGTQISATNTRINTLTGELGQVTQSLAQMDASIDNLESLRAELESVRAAVNSGNDDPLGLAGRLEYVEESMESVNAHRLQINEQLFQMRQAIEALQRQASTSSL